MKNQQLIKTANKCVEDCLSDIFFIKTKATRQIMLEVFKLLENFHESLILAGGWVPIMIIPEAEDRHVGIT